MQYSGIKYLLPLFILSSEALAIEVKPAREVRTYMPFTHPVDPTEIQTIPDITLSNALASSLAEWDDSKEVTANIAESWKIISPQTYRFILDKDVTWSNGAPVTSQEVKQSIERSLKIHAKDLKSIAQLIQSIEIKSESELDFKLSIPAQLTDLPEKLAKPQFGIVKIKNDGRLDLSVSTGAFTLDPSSNRSELILIRNPRWTTKSHESRLPTRIIIRRAPRGLDMTTILQQDPWPNLIETLSIHDVDADFKYSEKLEMWKSPLNLSLYIQLSERQANERGRSLIRFLRSKLNPLELGKKLTGFTITNQLFPKGFPLYDPLFSCQANGEPSLPVTFRKRPLEILITPTRIHPQLRENLKVALTRATGISPKFISVELDESYQRMIRGDFDLYAGTAPIAYPDSEEMASSYFEGKTPLIYSSGNQYLKRIYATRTLKDGPEKIGKTRTILHDAVCDGNILPFFHLSTLVMARSELDLKQIPESDESISLSKIRFKEAQ